MYILNQFFKHNFNKMLIKIINFNVFYVYLIIIILLDILMKKFLMKKI